MGESGKTAFVTGITGQDGSLLARLLLAKGYEVHGLKRRSSSFNTGRIDDLHRSPQHQDQSLQLHFGDITDSTNILRLIEKIRPDEIYGLAAQSHVAVSFETPEYTANADAIGTLRILEAIRMIGLENSTRFYQASTSELYGKAQETPQSESTPFYPRSPYGVAKLYAYWITVNYREAYGMHASNGILFNHEGPLRGETFVTRKITRAVAAIKLGQQDCLYLGNLNAQRDWGDARDFVRGMWLMMQQDQPDDWVLATGQTRSIREFAEAAFSRAGYELEWDGDGVDEIGRDGETGKELIKIDPLYSRPTEVDLLIGDYSKAKRELGWEPKISFDQMVTDMVEHDLDILSNSASSSTPNQFLDF
jgi:GDPmannose 4,6-dehydratase